MKRSPKFMKKGGMVGSDMAQDKKMVKTAVHKHEKAMHKGKPLTPMKKGGAKMAKGGMKGC